MTVEELVQAAAGGDEEAFAQLVGLHENKVYSLALRMCGNPEDAADAAQEAFLSAWRALPSFRGEAGFSTWLYRLTANASIDLLRRVRRQRLDLRLDDEDLGLTALEAGPGPQEAAEQGELRQAVDQALGQLGDSHRQVLVLRELSGLSYQEIAQALDIDLGTVKSRIARARLNLRKILLEDGNFFEHRPSKPLNDKNERG